MKENTKVFLTILPFLIIIGLIVYGSIYYRTKPSKEFDIESQTFYDEQGFFGEKGRKYHYLMGRKQIENNLERLILHTLNESEQKKEEEKRERLGGS